MLSSHQKDLQIHGPTLSTMGLPVIQMGTLTSSPKFHDIHWGWNVRSADHLQPGHPDERLLRSTNEHRLRNEAEIQIKAESVVAQSPLVWVEGWEKAV